MPLHYQDQINLIKDILSNQQSDCCGSVSEYQQLERLIKSLMANHQLSHQDINTLSQIYSYSQGGVYTANLDQHIESHQQELSQWVSSMDQFS